MRYALYFTPPADSDLHQRGSAVLGHDCYTGRTVQPPSIAGITPDALSTHTAGARKYGFHATIKPPFSLRQGLEIGALRTALADYAASTAPVCVGALQVAGPGKFVALEPVEPPVALHMFAAETMAWFDAFRAPLSPADLARRPPDNLPPRQQALQQRWGYPWVFEAFRFHMTLSDMLPDPDLANWRTALDTWFGPQSLTIDALTLLVQSDRAAPFEVVERYALTG